MYVCKYDGKTPFFQNYVTLNDNIQVALWYVSINVLHPENQKREKRTHSAILDPALWDTQSVSTTAEC